MICPYKAPERCAARNAHDDNYDTRGHSRKRLLSNNFHHRLRWLRRLSTSKYNDDDANSVIKFNYRRGLDLQRRKQDLLLSACCLDG